MDHETPFETSLEKYYFERIRSLEGKVNKLLRDKDSLSEDNKHLREMVRRREIREALTAPCETL